MPSYYPACSPPAALSQSPSSSSLSLSLTLVIKTSLSASLFPLFISGSASTTRPTYAFLPDHIVELVFFSIPWANWRPAMREAHSNGGRGHSPSGASTHNQQHLNPQPTSTATTNIVSLDNASACPPDLAACITSPISPPTSPPPSCLNLESFQHPVEMLAYRLRNQSFMQQSLNSTPVHANPSAALSPTSISDDDFLPRRDLSCHDDSMAMEIDDAEDDPTIPIIPNRNERRAYRKGLGIIVSSRPSESPSFIQPSPTAINPPADIKAQARSTNSTLYGPSLDLVCPELEVDEGYCEEEEDFSWLEPISHLRDVSPNDTSSPAGIRKRYGLRYRSSTEAATRCSNAVHSVPRMRRRDKRRRQQSRVSDVSTGERAVNAT